MCSRIAIATVGMGKYIEQEYNADLPEWQVTGINDFVTVVTARKAAL